MLYQWTINFKIDRLFKIYRFPSKCRALEYVPSSLFVLKVFKCQNLFTYVFSAFFNPISHTIKRKHYTHLLFLWNTCKNYETKSKFFSVQSVKFCCWRSLHTIYSWYWFLFLCLKMKRVSYLCFTIRLQAELIMFKKRLLNNFDFDAGFFYHSQQ